MNDQTTTIQQLKDLWAKFVQERDWQQFHSPKNVSMDIAIEAAELMEKFLWIDVADSHQEVEKNRQEIEDELADVIAAALCFANACNIDIARAVERKMAENRKKYPIEKAKGKYTKYSAL